MADIVYDTK